MALRTAWLQFSCDWRQSLGLVDAFGLKYFVTDPFARQTSRDAQSRGLPPPLRLWSVFVGLANVCDDSKNMLLSTKWTNTHYLPKNTALVHEFPFQNAGVVKITPVYMPAVDLAFVTNIMCRPYHNTNTRRNWYYLVVYRQIGQFRHEHTRFSIFFMNFLRWFENVSCSKNAHNPYIFFKMY